MASVDKKKAFCQAEGICHACFLSDPEVLRYLDRGLCPHCDISEIALRNYINEKQKNCSGCKDRLNNQQGHMQKGGCMALDSESESESESE